MALSFADNVDAKMETMREILANVPDNNLEWHTNVIHHNWNIAVLTAKTITVRAAGQEVSSTDSNIARVRKGVLP